MKAFGGLKNYLLPKCRDALHASLSWCTIKGFPGIYYTMFEGEKRPIVLALWGNGTILLRAKQGKAFTSATNMSA